MRLAYDKNGDAQLIGAPSNYGATWPKARAAAFARADRICQRCHDSRAVHVHHVLPVRFFEVVEDAHFDSNLIAVCHPCHLEEHRLLESALPLLNRLQVVEPVRGQGLLVNFYIEEDLLAAIDDYRSQLRPLPPRSKVIKSLIQRGLDCSTLPSTDAPPT